MCVLTVGVKTCAGGVGWKLGAVDENAPAFGGKRGGGGGKGGGLLLVLCGLMIEPLEQNEWQPYDIDRCGAQKRDEHGV